jgi:hypothetical protein
VRALWLALGALACSPAAAQERASVTPSAEREAPRLVLGALHELVPAAGLGWMVQGQPRKISQNADLNAAVLGLVASERFDAYASATGVDLRTLPSALVAGFELGTLYLAELPTPHAHDAMGRFLERLGGRAVVEQPHPRVLRAAGTVDGIPHGFVAMDDRVVGISIADLTLSRIAAGFATGKLKKSVPALRGAALSTLPTVSADSLAEFYAPGPFDAEWARGARGVLGAALAARISAAPGSAGHVALTLVLSGTWEQDGQLAAETLRLAFSEFAESSTGKLFGFEQARNVSANFHPQYLTLAAELPLAPLVQGLRAAVMADVWEMLDLPSPGPVPEAAPR